MTSMCPGPQAHTAGVPVQSPPSEVQPLHFPVDVSHEHQCSAPLLNTANRSNRPLPQETATGESIAAPPKLFHPVTLGQNVSVLMVLLTMLIALFRMVLSAQRTNISA